VKPENVLLTARGDHVYVADFGIALAVTAATDDRITQPGMIVGTPGYMSPECGGGLLPVDGRADVYSLACVVREMLTGERPTSTRAPVASGPASATDVDDDEACAAATALLLPAVVCCLAGGLARRPDDRYATATHFTEALAGSLGGSPRVVDA
jgi:serine/threonine-protein kinase